MGEKSKCDVQAQFDAHASAYIPSSAHIAGLSLERLVALADPQPGWRVLDVATGGGHTALAFAAHVEDIIAIDPTFSMLVVTRQHIGQQGAKRLAYCQAEAERLSFPTQAFDCVTCRIAAHHFSDVTMFIREAARVLRPGGILALADNIVSGEPKVAEFVNILKKLLDPSHNWAYALEDWEAFFYAAGLEVVQSETFEKEIDLDEWATQMGVTGNDLIRLRALLLQAPRQAREWLRPRQLGSRLVFTLAEAIIIGRKP